MSLVWLSMKKIKETRHMAYKQTFQVNWHFFGEETPREVWRIFVRKHPGDPGAMSPADMYKGKLYFESARDVPVVPEASWQWFYASDLVAGNIRPETREPTVVCLRDILRGT